MPCDMPPFPETLDLVIEEHHTNKAALIPQMVQLIANPVHLCVVCETSLSTIQII